MKILKQILFTFFLVTISTAVVFAQNTSKKEKQAKQATAKGAPVIKGKILNSSSSKVELKLAYGDNPQSYGTATVNPDGTFFMQTTVHTDDLYRLILSKDHFFLFEIVPGDVIDVVLDQNNLRTITSVTGSKPMSFVKNVTDNVVAGKQRLDSLVAPQNAMVEFYNKFYGKFDHFNQSNSDIDRCLISIFNYTDTLNSLMERYVKNEKVESKKLDSFMILVPKYFRSIESNYLYFENYLQNVGMYFDFTSDRAPGKEGFYKILDVYLDLLKERHELAVSTLDNYVNDIKPFMAKHDSLVFHNKLSKKKTKEEIAEEAVKIMSKYGQNVAMQKSVYLVKAQAGMNVNSDLMAYVQKDATEMTQRYQQISTDETERQRGELKKLILENKEYLAVLMFMDNFPKESNMEMNNEVLDALAKKYPDNILVQDLQNTVKVAGVASIGNIAPELEYENPEGKLMKLSSLRGKYVLIDFWASWCRPCRMENPTVVRLYNKYHNKGFDIYSVSLDKDKGSWMGAIAADNLVWENHVSDLKYWSSEGAKKYGVNSIPSTFLLDKEGRIIAKNLRGDALEKALKEIFGE